MGRGAKGLEFKNISPKASPLNPPLPTVRPQAYGQDNTHLSLQVLAKPGRVGATRSKTKNFIQIGVNPNIGAGEVGMAENSKREHGDRGRIENKWVSGRRGPVNCFSLGASVGRNEKAWMLGC